MGSPRPQMPLPTLQTASELGCSQGEVSVRPLDQCPSHAPDPEINSLQWRNRQLVLFLCLQLENRNGCGFVWFCVGTVSPQARGLVVQLSERRSEGQPCSQVIVGVQTAEAGLPGTGTSHLSLRKVFGNNGPDAAKPDAGWCSGLSLCLICL